MTMKKIALVACVLVLAGCNTARKPTAENYLKTINAYLTDHPDCLLDGSIHFPYETSDAAMQKKMDALVAAQILDFKAEPAIHIKRYTLKPEGVSAGANLCYGFREATSVTSSTPPAAANGFMETQVVYRYEIHDIPTWAKTPQVMDAFPALAHERSGDATDTITLALDQVGWSVPN
jgi:hypothetical protein